MGLAELMPHKNILSKYLILLRFTSILNISKYFYLFRFSTDFIFIYKIELKSM